jgi:hypothetical protein
MGGCGWHLPPDIKNREGTRRKKENGLWYPGHRAEIAARVYGVCSKDLFIIEVVFPDPDPA